MCKTEMKIMNEILVCSLVKKRIDGNIAINSEDKEDFIKQYRRSLEQTKGITGVVYVFKSEKPIPRLKGTSNILYIGETKYDVWNRYNVKNDTNIFWHVYSHVVKKYGAIFIDVYVTDNTKETEKIFLQQYFQEYKELPPINRKE